MATEEAWQSIEFFKPYEFDDPTKPNTGLLMDIEFVKILDRLRRFIGPIIITSGFRTLEHNNEIGGEFNSAHLRGLAADISCRSSDQRYRIVTGARLVGIGRIGIADTFVHLDNDPSLPKDRIWTY